jgi:hypothetical protein
MVDVPHRHFSPEVYPRVSQEIPFGKRLISWVPQKMGGSDRVDPDGCKMGRRWMV